MKGCLRGTRLLLHQRRDKGGNTHNFPFDTLTKVYRDTIYATQERYVGNPMYPERGPHGTAPTATPSSSSPGPSNVTNHVGNIGVMSPAATPLSEWIEELHHPQQPPPPHEGDEENHGHHHHHYHAASSSASPLHATPGSAASASSRHTRIVRGAAGVAAEAGDASSSPAANDEAVRARIRAHMFSGKRGHKSASGSAGTAGAGAVSAGPRHSGVQVEILNMYRSMLREVRRMDDPDTRRNLTAYIRSEFDKHRDVPRKNILKIEWQLNYGKRKLEDLQAMGKHTKFTMMR